MVSFSCESCGDVLTKKKLDPHRGRCRGATFTCIDCMVHFEGFDYRAHTSCITEEQKYQGNLYKNKNKKVKFNPPAAAAEAPVAKMAAVAHQPQPAYVEDVPEELAAFLDRDDDSDADIGSDSDDDAPPHAPTPPPADANVNVFDFLVANATPNASNLDLSPNHGPAKLSDSTQLVRYDRTSNAFLDQGGAATDRRELVQYGTGPVPRPGVKFETPGPRLERKKTRDGDKEVKKDKKRKRLHVDTDHVMSDAPPVLHSGLTGGLNRLMSRPSVFPPSPEYSADAAETPASPLKKSRHSKTSKSKPPGPAETIGNNLISMLTVKPKSKKRKSVSTVKKHRSHRRSDADKAPKMIEYRPSSKGDERDTDKEGPNGQLVVYKPRADLFLSFVNKGPDSERGCSMNKALKRFHRERSSAANNLGKSTEEKELWRSLRMRRNKRGEIVLFCV